MVTLVEFAPALLASLEGLRLRSYWDTGGVWTIGIGHTQGVTAGMTITAAQASQFFAADNAPLLAMLAGIPLLEAAALCSFGFNCGRAALQKVLDGHDLVNNPVHTTDRTGAVRSGLVARRRLEELLMLISQDQRQALPPLVPNARLDPGSTVS